MMKVEIVKRETIKPSSPTPPHLRNFKLSLLDQLSPLDYSTLVLFYPFVGGDGHDAKSQHLKRSLSETLTRFFPLAGIIKDAATIDCSDEGVSYFEACVGCRLEKVLERPETELLKQLVAVDDSSSVEEAGMGCLLLVQINFFECGGMAIGVSFSHKLCDAATFSAFIKSWSDTSKEYDESGDADHEPAVIVLPDFDAAKILFPPNDLLPNLKRPPRAVSSKFVTKRLLFRASKIADLKAKAASEVVPRPTRVEAVSALIWKCATTAARSSNSSEELGSEKRLQSVLGHTMNLRNRIAPPMPEYSFGNVLGYFAVQAEEENELSLQGLVGQLRKGMTDFCNNYASKLGGGNGVSLIFDSFKEAKQMMMGDPYYTCTSWCRFPFYDADFGWGKPAWVGTAISAYKNVVLLMDTRDGGGVHAYVSLTQEDMALFERDVDLLEFASINPSGVF